MACVRVAAVMRGERPSEPLDAESLGFSDTLWELVRLCWSKSSSTRPTALRLFDYFSSAPQTWTPPLAYRAIAVDACGTISVNSSSIWRTSLVILRDVGSVVSVLVGGSLVFIAVVFLSLRA